ncbi:hemerythrin domain-containing protein [Roseateles paludis]|uniref:Hemerythrin domain-containing protein n=1 Tax=Roseateles paludis TaxID=3145238 RepID=A0ABV0G3P8_9BURK
MPPTTPARHDLYAAIHKALRHFMVDTLMRLSRVDVADPEDLQQTLGQLDELLILCGQHLHNENSFIHPALEAGRPGVSARIGAEHEEHVQAIAELQTERKALAANPQPAGALRVYRRLSRFVAENFEHMLVEETRHNAALWELYTDAELDELHQRILQSLPMEEVQLVWRWLVPALSPQERADMMASMPPPVRDMALDVAQARLNQRDWAKLCRALQVAPMPGLAAA